MPLVFWPPSPQPFSTAKEWLGAAWILSALIISCSGKLLSVKLPSKVLLAGAIWIMAISLSAGTGGEASIRELICNLLPCLGFLLLASTQVRPQLVVRALILSGTIVGAIAILQFVSLDPYGLLDLTGSLQGSSRTRIFSTMGNPNFVAAFLTALLPLTLFGIEPHEEPTHRLWRVFQFVSLAIQAGAIVATGSRAPILGLVAAGTWILLRASRIRMRGILAGLAFCALLVLLSPARPLQKTIEGRMYIWRVALSHVREIPVAGFGPGAFRLHFAEWETEQLKKDPRGPDASFTGLQDHAHNDYIEYLVDYGIVGLSAFFAVVCLTTSVFRRMATPLQRGVSASIIALLTIALVDFPLHRPTELYLFWTQLALLWILERNTSPREIRVSSS